MKNSRIKNGIMRIVQGIIIGAGAILPGISGGVLAVVFGIYRPAMELLTHPRRALQRYWRMLLAVGIGWAIGFLGGGSVILALFHQSETVATCLFIGLILGTLPDLWHEAGTASQMFHVPVVKHGINGDLRQKGKIATLACGYGGSSGALISMGALQMGLHEEELPEIIDSWREANPKIVQYWWDTEKAAMTAYKTGERQEVGKIAFEFYSGTLWMVLPSGRRLAYLKPRQQPNRFGRMSLTYEGVGQNHKWSRQETYSGRLVENATQAIARDILAEAMDRISAEDLNIVAHVHDEVIIEAPKDQYTVDEVCKLMSVNPAWCKDLPLAAAGYKGNYYFKD